MTSREIYVGIGVTVVGGILVALFTHFFLSGSSVSTVSGAIAGRPSVYISELKVSFFGYAGLSYSSGSDASRKVDRFIAYRIYTDSDAPVSVEATIRSNNFVGGSYSYGRGGLNDGQLTGSIDLTVLPGNYLNVFTFWSDPNQDNDQLYFKSQEANIEKGEKVFCTFHPYLGNELCKP